MAEAALALDDIVVGMGALLGGAGRAGKIPLVFNMFLR
jgi:hypothetical protein